MHPHHRHRRPVASVSIALLAGTAALAAGCASRSERLAAARPGVIAVASDDKACTLSSATTPAGTVEFEVTNTGSQVTEFYLYAADGKRIVAEVENIGPALTRRLITTVTAGTYTAACKPGMRGDGIRTTFTVTAPTDTAAGATGDAGTTQDTTGDAGAAALAAQLRSATDRYAEYVRDESTQLLTGTKAFADAYRAGDDDAARAAYAPARVHWERIEPVAESFADLDPRLDLREADLEAGQAWTGWHRLEKDLWPPAGFATLTTTQRRPLADRLVADTEELVARIAPLTYTADQLANGAKELLDEVATGKVTGEEERWSGTDLWDFQANVDGARFAFEVLAPVVKARDESLASTLEERFAAVQALLDTHRVGDGFVLYGALSAAQVKQLADAVNALGEPLSQLTATVVR